jgi:hypothetical protein
MLTAIFECARRGIRGTRAFRGRQRTRHCQKNATRFHRARDYIPRLFVSSSHGEWRDPPLTLIFRRLLPSAERNSLLRHSSSYSGKAEELSPNGRVTSKFLGEGDDGYLVNRVRRVRRADNRLFDDIGFRDHTQHNTYRVIFRISQHQAS